MQVSATQQGFMDHVMALESEHIEICLIHGFVLFPTDYSPNSATELRAGMRCKLAAWIALRTGQANDAIAFKANLNRC